MRPKRADLRLGGPRRGQSPVEHRGSEADVMHEWADLRPENAVLGVLRPGRTNLRLERAKSLRGLFKA